MNIAIVDDEKNVRDEIQEYLEKYYTEKLEEDVHYVQFSNGDTFLKSMEKTKYHIVILDIEMPGKNGIEIKELLRKFLPKVNEIGSKSLDFL